MKVALTGGSGVVGGALLRLLVEGGHEVAALSRSSATADMLESCGARPLPGDVLDPGSLAHLVSGADWVFHVAGVNQMCPTNPELMYKVNVEGSRNVLEACKRGDVGRLIHTSSTVALGEQPGQVGSEQTVHRGTYISHYEASKHKAELALLSDRDHLDLVVVSPASVQGPGRATGTAKLIIDVINGRLPFLVDTTFSLVDIDDCADGHIKAASKGEAGSRYVLSAATLSVRDALEAFAEAVGIPLRPRFVPAGVASLAAGAVEATSRLLGRHSPVCREMIRVLKAGARYDGSLATRKLGLLYRPVEETIRRAVEWYRSEGLID